MNFSRMLPIAPLVALITLTGCEELLSTTQAVGVLTATPSLADAQGLDPALELLLPTEQLENNVTAVMVGVLHRDTGEAITGAQVSLTWGADRISVCEGVGDAPSGSYTATSVPTAPCGDELLTYAAGEAYTAGIVTGADNFSMTVVAPQALDASYVDFSPTLGTTPPSIMGVSYNVPTHAANRALTVDWSRDAGAGDRPTFVVVMRLRVNGMAFEADQQPVFDNTPRKPAEMINLILEPPPTSIEIPASAFDAAGIYFIVLTNTELSTDTENLSLGSGALAGRGTAFAIWVP